MMTDDQYLAKASRMLPWSLAWISDREIRALNVGSYGYVLRIVTYRMPNGSLVRQRMTGIRRLGTVATVKDLTTQEVWRS